jgi:membrane protein DedA with SNARE-associated domain
MSLSGIIEQLGALIEQIIVGMGYVGITLVMLIENLFPPIPSELVMPLAGFFSAEGQLWLPGVWLAGTLGSVLGAIVLYYIGRGLNETVLRWIVQRYGRWVGISMQDVDRTLSVFDRHGQAIVFFGRLIPLVRSLISIPAGMHKMPMLKFVAFTTAGSAIWSAVLAIAGYVLGRNWRQVLDFINAYQRVTLAVLAVAVVALIVWWLVRRARRPASDPNTKASTSAIEADRAG